MNCKLAILAAAFLMSGSHRLRADDNATPQPAISPATLPDVPMKKVPFVGILTMPVDAVLARQLDLPEGMGLVVADIADNSPAQQFGMQRHDVLVKLEDQLLCNPQQLQTLIRARKKGDTVTFLFRRDGKELSQSIQLGENDVPVVPRDMLIFRNTGTPVANPVMNEMPIDAQTLQQLHQATGGAMLQATMVINDNEHCISSHLNDGKMDVTAKDIKGNVIYSGPVALTTDGKVDMEHNKDVPAVILEKLQRTENMTKMLDVKFGTAPSTQPSAH